MLLSQWPQLSEWSMSSRVLNISIKTNHVLQQCRFFCLWDLSALQDWKRRWPVAGCSDFVIRLRLLLGFASSLSPQCWDCAVIGHRCFAVTPLSFPHFSKYEFKSLAEVPNRGSCPHALKESSISLLLFWSVNHLWPVCFFPAVHPDDNPDHLHEPQCLSSTGHALYAQGVHHHLPPWAQRTEEEA